MTTRLESKTAGIIKLTLLLSCILFGVVNGYGLEDEPKLELIEPAK
jgi:hypothetical protein